MFTLSNLIPNDGVSSFINEVCFHPSGEMFGATYEHTNEVRIYNAQTLSVIRVIRNPGATLNQPHGLLLTARHVIVANNGTYPCQFRIFRLDDASGTPVHTYTTPYAHLAIGHSLALNGRRLVVTYCDGYGKKGALVSYDYDDESGRIVGPRDMQERWFRRYGDPKGISFDETGDKVYVTFQSDAMTWRRKALTRVKNLVSLGLRGATSRNGIAVFGIDRQGRFTRSPVRKSVFRKFCRLENIHVRADHAVVTNADGGCVLLYEIQHDDAFAAPLQVLSDPLVFPHGAKLSPDGNLLVVADNGIGNVDHQVRWKSFVFPRKDRLVVFKLQAA